MLHVFVPEVVLAVLGKGAVSELDVLFSFALVVFWIDRFDGNDDGEKVVLGGEEILLSAALGAGWALIVLGGIDDA